MSSQVRAFPFRVRPLHRETLESLTRRVLTANGEPATLPKRLLAEHDQPSFAWPDLLHQKNRSTAHQKPRVMLQHADGSTCSQCTDLLTRRWMCTLCAHGDHVEQDPHFDAPVCIRHRRWLGFTDAPESQHPVDTTTVRAALRFAKLVADNRLDPRLYGLISRAVSEELGHDEAAAFAPVINLIATTTNAGFLRHLLDPRGTFASAYNRVCSVVTTALGRESLAVTRVLWLAMRPAFAVAHARTTGQDLATHPHDFPLPKTVLAALATAPQGEPFAAFLRQTHDTPESAAAFLGENYRRLDPRTRRRHVICAHGHGFSTTRAEPVCPQCPRGGAATFGVNDLTTLAPHLTAEWDVDANDGLVPSMVAASSHRKYHWRCTAHGHPFTASPSNRTQTGADCPVCLNRIIVPGINDFASRFPDVFAELSPSDAHQYNPHRNTPTSNKLARWQCAAGHTFKARFIERANGYTCPECRRRQIIAKSGSLANNHPGLASEWVVGPDRRGPADFSAGSSYLATWRCETGHEYTARIERRVHGTKCPYCSHRKLLPGFNDLATTHPRLATEWDSIRNEVTAADVLAGSIAKRSWVCRNGHETQQTIPHRITSRGCTSCAPGERALHPSVTQAAQGPLECPTTEPKTDRTAPSPEPESTSTDECDEQAMLDVILDLYAPQGFPNDTIVEAWAEAAGFTAEHAAPAPVLQTLLTVTPMLGGRSVPHASDLADTIVDMFDGIDAKALPPRRRLISATRAATKVIHLIDGPFDTEDAFCDALKKMTVNTSGATEQVSRHG